MAWLSSFFGTQRKRPTSKQATLLDVVMYAASLVSNPRDIDPMLDKVREMTSRLKPGEQLSSDDEKTLGAIYGELEHYLVEQEQIRKFTADEVRKKVSANFPNMANTLSRSSF